MNPVNYIKKTFISIFIFIVTFRIVVQMFEGFDSFN